MARARLIGLHAVLLVCGMAMRARADAPEVSATAMTSTELGRLCGGLGSADEATRERTARAIAGLGEEAVPAIVQRLRDPSRPDAPAVWRALRAAKDRAPRGSRGDLVAGFLVVLQRNRSEENLRVFEQLLFMRALEGIGTLDASRVIVDMASIAGGQFRAEVVKTARRMQHRMVAAMIEARRHPSREMQRWVRHTLWQLGLNKPGDVVQTRDNTVLADIVRAYGTIQDPKAIRVVVSFVTSERVQVREAARWAIRQYGQGGLWIVREAFENATGQEAPADWTWERAIDELFAFHDRARLADVHALLDEGLAAWRRGDHASARRRFEEVLARAPLIDRRAEIAFVYRSLGEQRMAADDLVGAERDFRQAMRLLPEGDPSAGAVGSLIAYARAERSLAAGVADLSLYREAVRLDPQNTRARSALHRLSWEERTRARHQRKMGAAGAVLVLAVALLALLARRRSKTATPAAPPAEAPPASES